ncbi:MAG: sulfurtransferase, partial [Chloroflexi bacterium]|nr:sulfurtransferase [Chloroflexota bacterium]
AAAEAYADRLAADDGVRPLDVAGLQALMGRAKTETIYLVDVRSREEYEAGHIPGFRWVPGGQAVQRTDEVAVVKNATVVFACDGRARATQTASFYRQMGIQDVYVLQGGTAAWQAAGLALESGRPKSEPLGLADARSKSTALTAKDADSQRPVTTIFVDTSQDFARAHVPGSHWITRGWLELHIDRYAPDKAQPVLVTCTDGQNSVFAAAALVDMGYTGVSVLQGGLRAWQADGLDVESGLTGVMAPPTDVLYSGPDRTYAEMMHYLRWETALGEKYA